MGGKYKKRLREEKAKIKLKKKPLPKGQNITDTTFKVRKIVVPEQLKPAGPNEIVSKRKLTLKDLKNRLEHHNVNTQVDAIAGIRELITFYPEEMNCELRYILSCLLPLVTSIEKNVRRHSISLITDICYKFEVNKTTNKLVPSYHEMVMYLASAMTHIHIEVQNDSFLLLDAYLKHLPELISLYSTSIINNFLNLISKPKNELQPDRTLHVAFDSHVANSWRRISVFKRLYNVLTILSQKTENNEETKVKDIIWDDKKSSFLQIIDFSYDDAPTSSLFDDCFSRTSISSVNEKHDIKKYTNVIMPLLFETWLEVSPKPSPSSFGLETPLNEEMLSILNVVVNTMKLLWSQARAYDKSHKFSKLESSFIQDNQERFNTLIIQGFPYCKSIPTKKRKHQDQPNEREMEYSFLEDNLVICYMYYSFGEVDSSVNKRIRKCITKYMATINKPCDALFPVLEAALLTPKFLSENMAMLKYTLMLYWKNPKSDTSKQLHDILLKIATDSTLLSCVGLDSYYKWFKTLPKNLHSHDVPMNIVSSILTLAIHNDDDFVASIEENLPTILEMLPNMRVQQCDKLLGQKQVASLLYWCQPQVIKQIINSDILDRYPLALKSYIIDILSYKFDVMFE